MNNKVNSCIQKMLSNVEREIKLGKPMISCLIARDVERTKLISGRCFSCTYEPAELFCRYCQEAQFRIYVALFSLIHDVHPFKLHEDDPDPNDLKIPALVLDWFATHDMKPASNISDEVVAEVKRIEQEAVDKSWLSEELWAEFFLTVNGCRFGVAFSMAPGYKIKFVQQHRIVGVTDDGKPFYVEKS